MAKSDGAEGIRTPDPLLAKPRMDFPSGQQVGPLHRLPPHLDNLPGRRHPRREEGWLRGRREPVRFFARSRKIARPVSVQVMPKGSDVGAE